MSSTQDGIPSPKTRWNASAILRIFERQVLVFPLLVVILACTSFLFGGQCATWQWLAAAVVVVGAPFLKHDNGRAALGAAGMFAGLLVVIKGVLPPLFWDNAGCVDMPAYHLPMIQLLIEGWNPVTDPLAKEITASLGLDLWGMAPLHVAFTGKTMAVFAAVAYHFVGDPTALTIPGLAFLWLGVALQTTRLFRGMACWATLLALVYVLPLIHLGMFVDLSLACAACGLLLTMANDLKRGECDWGRLTVWTIWTMTIKLNGALAAFVFCAGFALVMIWRRRSEWKRWIGRFAVFGAGVALAWGVISWNPLVTSWEEYGHPLYPFATVDEAKWPVCDLTWDMRVVNEDYRQMGRLGGWLREYVSPGWAQNHWCRTTGRADFSPARPVEWGEYDGFFCSGNEAIRFLLWGLLVALLAHPRGWMFGLGGGLLTLMVPWHNMGYLRYMPWLSSLGCLAVAVWSDTLGRRLPKRCQRLAMVVFAGVAGLLAGTWLWQHARDVEFKATETALVRERVRCRFWPNRREPVLELKTCEFCPRYDYLRTMENHCRMLLKEMGRETTTQMMTANGWLPPPGKEHLTGRPLWKWDERQWFVPESEREQRCVEELGVRWQDGNVWDGFCDSDVAEAWVMTPWRLYLVPWGENSEHVREYYEGAEPHAGEGRLARLWRRLAFAAHVWARTYPHEVWKCLG